MFLQKKHIYYITLIMFLSMIVFSLTYKRYYRISGIFAMDSFRERAGIYLVKQGKVTFLTDKASFPKWSSNGKIIGCINANKVLFINPKNGDIIKKITFGNMQVLPFTWASDNSFLIIPLRVFENNFYHYVLVKYILKTNNVEVLYKFLFRNTKFRLKNLCLNKNNTLLSFFSGSNSLNSYLCMINLETKEFKYLWKDGYPIGWINNNLLLFFSNNNQTMDDFNEGFGGILNMDIVTRNINVIESFMLIESENIRLSRDSKYLYYSQNIVNKGSQIIVNKIGRDRNLLNQINITTSFFINNDKGYSKDMEPDWY